MDTIDSTVRFVRALDAAPRTIDAEQRSVEVTFSTGVGVARRDWEGPFLEVLSLDPGAVNLTRVPGMPVLNAHRNSDLGSVLGVVRDAKVNGQAGTATIVFSRRPDVEPFFQDVRDGILRNVSVGYSVDKWADSTDSKTGLRTRNVLAWTLLEISFVPVAADSGATVRSEKENMMDQAITALAIPPAATTTRAQVDTEIRRIATVAGLETTFADEQIARVATVDQARAAAFEALETRSGGPIRTASIAAGFSNEDPAVIVERMAEALVCRIRPSNRPSEAARVYMNRRLVDMAGELLTRRGERGVTMMSPDMILQRAAHTTSDFPNLLTATSNRILMPAYEAAASPLKALARPTSIVDFRAKSSLRLGAMEGGLQKVLESGEVTSTTRSEAKESYSLSTFARIFSLSRQAMINDDLGAFSDWAAAMGRAAAETEARELVALLVANSGTGPTMDDGVVLFHADHGNLAGSGGAIGITTLGAGRQAIRDQVGLASEPINVVPKFLLVSSAKETLAEQTLATLYPATISEANPFQGRLTLMVEPRLSGTPWYLFADPTQAPVLEYAYLTSAPGPQVAMREGWDVLGAEFRAILDFGCGAVDHRGAYRNAGA